MKCLKYTLVALIGGMLGILVARSFAALATAPASATSQPVLGMNERVLLNKAIQDSGQTNIAILWNQYLNTSQAAQAMGNLSHMVIELNQLRIGETNQCIVYLENDLDANILRLAANYKQLTPSQKEQVRPYTKLIDLVLTYREEHPPQWTKDNGYASNALMSIEVDLHRN